MKRRIIIAMMLVLGVAGAQAQEMDEELETLVSWVKMLRDGSSVSYARVQKQLKSDPKWTPMNETGTLKEQECKPSEIRKRFKLNRILSQVDEGRKKVATHGDMLNGEDERYDYSLYERSVKAKATVAYTLKGREGKQTFIIVPYDASKSGLTAKITLGNGRAGTFKKQTDGTLAYTGGDAALGRNDVITITVSNTSAANQAFVLLNHNTRNK